MILKSIRQILLKIPYWCIPLFFCLLFFDTRGVRTSPDSAFYLSLATNLFEGKGYVDVGWEPYTIRGPVFPAVIAASFALLGSDLEHAFWVIRLCFLAVVMLTYALGTLLFDRTQGLVASMLVVSSLLFHQIGSMLLPDLPMAMFVLLSQVLILLAFRRRYISLFIAAGAMISIAVLTKQTAGVFAATPILIILFCREYRNWRMVKFILAYAVSAAIVISPWLVYLQGVGASPLAEFRLAYHVVTGSDGSKSAVETPKDDPLSTPEKQLVVKHPTVKKEKGTVWSALKKFYKKNFLSKTPLAPLIVFGWMLLLLKSIWKREFEDIFLLSNLMLFIPLVSAQFSFLFGVRHNTYLYIISALVLARMIYPRSIAETSQQWWKAISITCIFATLTIQFAIGPASLRSMFVTTGRTGYSKASGCYAPSFGKPGFEYRGTVNDAGIKTAQWLSEHLKPGEIVAGDTAMLSAYRGCAVYFGYRGVWRMVGLPVVHSNSPGSPEQSPVLFVWSHRDFTSPRAKRARLSALSEPALIDFVQSENPRYLILSDRSDFLSLYAMQQPHLLKVAQFGRLDKKATFQVFEFKGPLVPISSKTGGTFEMIAGKGLSSFLKNSKREMPADFQTYKRNFLIKRCGLSKIEVENLVAGSITTFRSIGYHDFEDYLDLLRRSGPEALTEAINIHEGKLALDNENPWTHLTLARLYWVTGDREKASNTLRNVERYAEENGSLQAELGNAYLAFSDSHRALTHFKKAYRLGGSTSPLPMVAAALDVYQNGLRREGEEGFRLARAAMSDDIHEFNRLMERLPSGSVLDLAEVSSGGPSNKADKRLWRQFGKLRNPTLSNATFLRAVIRGHEWGIYELPTSEAVQYTYLQLARALVRDHQKLEAEKEIRYSLMQMPESVGLYILLAEFLFKDGRKEDAITVCERGLSIIGEHPSLRAALKRFNLRLRKTPSTSARSLTPEAST